MPQPPKQRPRPHEASVRGRPQEFDRDAALNAAMEVFWRKGYAQTTLGDLCEAMGIRAPSFYLAFGSRADIFLETVAHYRKTYWDKALEGLMREGDICTALKNFIEEAVRIYMRPGLSKGCFIDVSTMSLDPGETRILEALAAQGRETEALFRCATRWGSRWRPKWRGHRAQPHPAATRGRPHHRVRAEQGDLATGGRMGGHGKRPRPSALATGKI